VAAFHDYQWLVFVSSTMPRARDPRIAKDRRIAVEAVSSLDGWFKAWTWEDCAFPGRFPPDSIYVKEAERAHILILLIHDRLTPNTKKEYDASVLNQRGQMIFFRDGFRLKPPAREFQKRLKGATYWRYKNLSELKSIIIKDLRGNVLRYADLGMQASVGTSAGYNSLGV